MTASPPLLGAYAAKQCPYRLFREYDPTEPAVPAPADDALQQLFDDGIDFEADIVAELLDRYGDRAVSIPGRTELDAEPRRELTDAALTARTPIILGALMAHDVEGRRLGEIDILLATGRITSAGKAEYRAIDVKSHRCTTNLPEPTDVAEPRASVHDLALLEPVEVAGIEPGYSRDQLEGDCMQLAHYHRLLQATGHAEPDSGDAVWGGVLGSERVVAWFDLTRPAFNTNTPQERDGADGPTITFHRRWRSRKRSALDRYDFEFDFRLRVVDTAVQRTSRDEPPMVEPVLVAECERCPWNEPCNADLVAADDVSLVKPVGYPEWKVHRFMGVDTVTKLAELDRTAAAAMYADTPITATAIDHHIDCARSAAAGKLLVRPDWDPASIPRGDIEIDLDFENEAFVYLWGARLTRVPASWPERVGEYRPFASFDPLDSSGEAALVAELWAWLADLRMRASAEDRSLRIYTYSHVEGTALKRVGATLGILGDVESLLDSDQWVDLYPHMQRKFMSNQGHGLKVVADASGFEWRDDDPGGYASMQWYRDAMNGVGRDANIARILEYNEDDCAATAAIR